MRPTQLKMFSFTNGVSHINIENCFTGQLPRRVIIGFLATDRYNGNYKLNPYKFEHFDLNYLVLGVNGVQIPARALEPDFTNDKFALTYQHFLKSICVWDFDRSCGISREEYGKGYTLFSVAISPDGCQPGEHFSFITNGSLRLECKFATPLAQPTHLFVMGEFDNMLEIDINKSVAYDTQS